jgi:hypothetical protein
LLARHFTFGTEGSVRFGPSLVTPV